MKFGITEISRTQAFEKFLKHLNSLMFFLSYGISSRSDYIKQITDKLFRTEEESPLPHGNPNESPLQLGFLLAHT